MSSTSDAQKSGHHGAGEQRSAPKRHRSRLARLTGRMGGTDYSPILEPLIRTLKVRHPKEDLDVIIRAFTIAEQHHDGQFRKSGDPYITHPVAVATILAELGMTGTTLAAALLHDTVEDTSYSLEQLTAEFGEEVALLVDGVTKLDKVHFGAAAQAETVRKMVLAMAKDVRVLLIKLADRLHNARTWRYVPPESSARKAQETLEIYAPLAHRLGMNTIKWELEDLSFAALWPKMYAEIVRLVGERTPERQKNIAQLTDIIEQTLREAKINATITGRPKHYYSIYQKMQARGKEFNDIYDLLGVRVMVDSVRDCYAALGVLHAKWSPMPGRFKDYIAMPKYNMYQSLHTTVIGPRGKPVEIQIRTHEMHHRAEYGVAAHWKYKHRGGGNAADTASTPGWLKAVLDWQKDAQDPDDFLDSLRTEIGSSEVYVFTPQGEIKALPSGSTPVDFAYAVHTQVGHRTVGARVNGRLVALNYVLNHGDWVEIFTSKSEDAAPSQDWLGFVRSGRARHRIRQWFSKERREEIVERGKEQLTKEARKHPLPLQKIMNAGILGDVADQLNVGGVSGVYAAIGDGNVSVENVLDRVEKLVSPPKPEPKLVDDNDPDTISLPLIPRPTRGSDSGVVVPGAGDVMAKLARCCTPVPPDEIIGFVTRGTGISVHRADCNNISNLANDSERLIQVDWQPTQDSVFIVDITVDALDRTSLLSDVTRILAEHHVNILSATSTTRKNRIASSSFVFEMGDPGYLKHLLNAIRRIDGVYEVYRSSERKKRSSKK
ncbi:bifunctional (p)ppGpp synthetase/guanosine-3',5'-bis(diphosphate) 3'-pyrophosphohydrolase [Auritidibacter sp. NML120636]|nr:bifunctional (p)ppGpp synthetase/guanosine-3',5'-bis(diphosphate) 3'-pyrophosphohydrolase [Auritidibacter sp. NML120636]